MIYGLYVIHCTLFILHYYHYILHIQQEEYYIFHNQSLYYGCIQFYAIIILF